MSYKTAPKIYATKFGICYLNGKLLVRLLFYLQICMTNEFQGDWLLEPSADKVDEFVKVDVVITGYTYIIFMHRKVGLIGSNLTISPADTPQLQPSIVLEASRRVIELSVDLINMFPYPEGLSMVLVYYRIDIPIALLYCHVLYLADTHEKIADVQRLQNLTQCICSITHGWRELAPIGRAMQTLNRAAKDQGAVP